MRRKKQKKEKRKNTFIHHAMQGMTTRGRLTFPQALQWCLRLVRALKGSLHFMHMVTSLSRIQRGARLPSSALWKSGNGAHSGHGLVEKPLGVALMLRDAHRHFLPFSQRVLERVVLLLEDLDGLLESLENEIKARSESAAPAMGSGVEEERACTFSQSALSCSELKREKKNQKKQLK